MSTIHSLLNPPTRSTLERRIDTLVELLGNTDFAKGWGQSITGPLRKAFPTSKDQDEDPRAVNVSAYLVVLQESLIELRRLLYHERFIVKDEYLFTGAIVSSKFLVKLVLLLGELIQEKIHP